MSDRVATARDNKGSTVATLTKAAGLKTPVSRLYMRAIKDERILEVWGGDDGPMRLIKAYPVAAMSGGLGPKRREGDSQVPEGLYLVDRFNPKSSFLLSLGLNYPNASDKIRSDSERPGGDIFIHGGQASIGCLAMTDPAIQEIYLFALDAKRPIRVDLFPFRFRPGWQNRQPTQHLDFWKELEPFYAAFEKSKTVPQFRVDKKGRYRTVR
ncbi:MAG: L,D-transpeptidase family protein [Fimbriimonadaceae bacterium]|nr:L,D-transpeptidase family protein [Fimbriimonadaceae bacterium]QYK57493.1 MAG: L,D-transpeptidase family protein [Fimbriimonadaceae bacterium]